MSTVRTRFAPSPTGYMHVGTLTKQQADSTQYNRLTGTRLTRDNGETCTKANIKLFYKRVILYVKRT